SPDINRGVERTSHEDQGAGDQGMMFGYACNETPDLMPLSLSLAHLIMRELAELRKGKLLPYLRPDAKSQVTVEYDGETHKPVRIHTIVISTQHDEFEKPEDNTPEAQERADKAMLNRIENDIKTILLPRVLRRVKEEERALFDENLKLYVNPTGKFVIGGPHGDTGLTGRKIIVDTYGGRGAHGGGAFSGKDPSKVDRSAAYAARHIAKNAVAAGIADEMLVQISYAIGKADPVSFYVNTYGTSHVDMTDSEIAQVLQGIFNMRPHAIEERLKLRMPIYEETAAYGHMGRTPKVVTKHFSSKYEGERTMQVELFTWEKLDYVEKLKNAFHL
ncbi:MAG: methionine adenosyltransferase, partial [Muribaculaceae bacterium]|nr:methionine adenosyltransferase [Muribaculaceae bacterium]